MDSWGEAQRWLDILIPLVLGSGPLIPHHTSRAHDPNPRVCTAALVLPSYHFSFTIQAGRSHGYSV